MTRIVLFVLLAAMGCSNRTCELPPKSQDCQFVGSILVPTTGPSPLPAIDEYEARKKAATPKYERCAKRAKKSKDECAIEKCNEEYSKAVFPGEWEQNQYSACRERLRERAKKVKCIRKALKIRCREESADRVLECFQL